MADVAAEPKRTASRELRRAPLVHRGVVIQQPPVAPHTPILRIRKAARIAVEQYVRERADRR